MSLKVDALCEDLLATVKTPGWQYQISQQDTAAGTSFAQNQT